MTDDHSDQRSSDRQSAIDRLTTRREILTRAVGTGASLAVLGPAAAALAGCAGDSESAEPTTSAAGDTAKRGGTFRIALAFDSASATLDPHKQFAGYPDGCRANNVFDMLTDTAPDGTVEMRLAESIEAAADGMSYTVRLRPDVTFHDGKPLTIDDVIYSYRRTADPKTGGSFTSQFESVDAKNIRKLDGLTAVIPLNRPNTDLIGNFFLVNIIQDGANDFTSPAGTGPFSVESFTPGREFTFKANPNYWVSGQPYVDELHGVLIADQEARVNALLAGDVDAIESLTLTRAKSFQDSGEFAVRALQCNTTIPFVMNSQETPFTDPLVRQAIRLIADRQELVTSAFAGYGAVTNDLYGRGQPLFNDELPPREQDLEQAKALLQQAGQEGLKIVLSTSAIQAGMVEASTVFAEQAREAGVQVELEEIPSDSFYGDRYLHYPFSATAWGSWSIPLIYEQTLWSKGPWPETQWKDPEFDKIFLEAQGATSPETKRSLYFDLQERVYNDGGYLYWADGQWVEGYGSNVRGVSERTYYPLGAYDFRSVSLA
jgi:peptide/nickel transport system substrate-binding protein